MRRISYSESHGTTSPTTSARTYVTKHERFVTDALENWRNKYAVTLSALVTSRDSEAMKLAGFLKELGYE
jgi:hypothetical protein